MYWKLTQRTLLDRWISKDTPVFHSPQAFNQLSSTKSDNSWAPSFQHWTNKIMLLFIYWILNPRKTTEPYQYNNQCSNTLANVYRQLCRVLPANTSSGHLLLACFYCKDRKNELNTFFLVISSIWFGRKRECCWTTKFCWYFFFPLPKLWIWLEQREFSSCSDIEFCKQFHRNVKWNF